VEAPEVTPIEPTTNVPEIADEEKAEELICVNFMDLTPEKILAHKDSFESFMETYDLDNLILIGKLGFDLNAVMAKKELISNFLKAVKALNE